jgi:enoyl-CoA hydratase
MSEPVLIVDKQAGVTRLTLNRPRAMNALSRELREALAEAFRAAAEDVDTGVVILTGSGDRAFCAGLDLKEMSGAGGEGNDAAGMVAGGADVIRAMEAFDRPIIGAINGVAITGGFELALACDVLLGTPATRFADTHARVGIMPGWGLSQKLSRLVGIQRAKALSLTGNFLAADDALAWGLLSRVVPHDELLPAAQALAADMLSCVPEVLRAYKGVIDDGFAGTYADGRKLESRVARDHAADVTPEAVAERRLAVQQRGRSQAGAD